MEKRLIKSLKEAVAYAKGDTSKGYETKIAVLRPVEIPEEFDVQALRRRLKTFHFLLTL